MHKSSLFTGVLLVLALLVVLLPGCGGGGSAGGISPTATPAAATATPKPTATLVPFDSVWPRLTFKASSDSNFVEEQPYYADITPSGSSQNVSLSFATSGSSRIDGVLKNAVQGKIYTPTSLDISTLPTISNNVGGQIRLFTFQGGTIKITVLKKASAELTFEEAIFAPKVGGSAGGAKGTVTVNGTIGGAINGDFIGD